jgi:hypothetical protein
MKKWLKAFFERRLDVIHMECRHLALIKEPTLKAVVFDLNAVFRA